jgi:tRNA(His) 5'-end guanylyltransferase
MHLKEFEAQMREHERMGKTRIPAGYIVLRLDGKGFSKFTEKHFEKPFDLRMSELMVNTATALVNEFGAIYGYTESDEMSLLLPAGFNLHDRQFGKLLSISSAIVASSFTLQMAKAGLLSDDSDFVAFDSRVWFAETREKVADYFRWRESDAVRCGLNTWIYWTLRRNGYTPGQATRVLDGQGVAFKVDLLKQFGVNFDEVPAWQKRGIGLYGETYLKDGTDPRTGETVKVPRRRIKVDRSLPEGKDYSNFILQLMTEDEPI